MLHYTSQGVGKTIVLLHGFCEHSTCFNKQVFLLQGQYNVITIDLPGHGQSPAIPSFTIEQVADEVSRVLDALSVDLCVMIGHSMGGYVTLAFAKHYGHRLAGFGLLHSTANADNAERKTKRDQAIAVIGEKGAERYVQAFIPPLYAEGFSPAIIAERQSLNRSITAETLVACLTAMKNRDDSNAFIAETPLPVGLLIGQHDTLIPAQDMLRQAAAARTAMVVMLEQAAHMGMLEEPEKTAEGIRSFAEFCFSSTKNTRVL